MQPSTTSTIDIATWKQSCYDAMNDDFNTPILIAQLFEGARFINLVNDGAATLTSEDIKLLSDTLSDFIFTVLGLNNTSSAGTNGTDKLKGVVEMLIQMRNEARANKNFALSDEIRDKLQELGIIIKDGKEGTTFSF